MKTFFNIFLHYYPLWSNYTSTPLQQLDGKSHSTDSSSKLKTCIVWVCVTTDKQYWRLTESKVNDCNDGRKLYIMYTKGVIIPELMISKGFAFFRLFWKLWLYFLRILIKFSNFLTTLYFFSISLAAAATWDTPRHSACLLFLSSWPSSHLENALRHHPAWWEESVWSPCVQGIKRCRAQGESLTHSAYVFLSGDIRDASI